MRAFLIWIFILSSTGCQAQIQKWQRERTLEHLSRLKNYHGHIKWTNAGETSESEIWFETPNHILAISKNGEIFRSDGSTMEVYDPRTKFYSIFRHLPPITESDNQELIRDLFDQSMKAFTFTLGPLGKVADRAVIELRSKPKGSSVIASGESQIFDEYSFPLKSVVVFKNGQNAKFEFTDIAFNEKFEMPKAKIPSGAFRLEWDFNSPSPAPKAAEFRDLKLEKVLRRETGETLTYYRNRAQFISLIRYKNLGMPPQPRGVSVKVAGHDASLLVGPISSMLMLTDGDTTSFYSSNLLVDDLIEFASK